MLTMFKEFLRNPVQMKYLPVFVCLLMAAIFTAITHQAMSVLIPTALAGMNLISADSPLKKFFYYGYILLAAAFSSMTVMMVFVGALQAAAVAGIVASVPLSILLTRKLEEKHDVQ